MVILNGMEWWGCDIRVRVYLIKDKITSNQIFFRNSVPTNSDGVLKKRNKIVIKISRVSFYSIIFSLLFLQSCAKTTDGEVFAYQNKLGGIKIFVVSEKNASKAVKEASAEIIREKAVIVDKLKSLDWKVINRAYAGRTLELKEILNRELDKLNFKALKNDLDRLVDQVIYKEKLQAALVSNDTIKTVSDSDGKFSLSAPGNSYIFAISDNGYPFWIIDLSKVELKLQLTESNIIGKNCAECVVKVLEQDIKDTDALFRFIYIATLIQEKKFITEAQLGDIKRYADEAGFK